MSSIPLDRTALTRNQTLVLDALSHEIVPQSAYTLLSKVREHGINAPLQVYRALDKLIEMGLAHRVESLNAFIACHHPHDRHQDVTILTICDACGQVNELIEPAIGRPLRKCSEQNSFSPEKITVEMRGICEGCKNG